MAIWLWFHLSTFPYIKEIVEIALTVSEYSCLPQMHILGCGLQTCVYFSDGASEAHPSLQIPFKYIGVWKWISHTSRQGALNLGSVDFDGKNYTIVFTVFLLGFIIVFHYDSW